MKPKLKSLNDLKREIRDEVKRIDARAGPYSRNIIGISLREIDHRFGRDKANAIVDELDLEAYGFNKEPV